MVLSPPRSFFPRPKASVFPQLSNREKGLAFLSHCKVVTTKPSELTSHHLNLPSPPHTNITISFCVDHPPYSPPPLQPLPSPNLNLKRTDFGALVPDLPEPASNQQEFLVEEEQVYDPPDLKLLKSGVWKSASTSLKPAMEGLFQRSLQSKVVVTFGMPSDSEGGNSTEQFQCRKSWSILAGDFKNIKEYECGVKEETESVWLMRNDLRREDKLPGFFDKNVYDILQTEGCLTLALMAPFVEVERELLPLEVGYKAVFELLEVTSLLLDFGHALWPIDSWLEKTSGGLNLGLADHGMVKERIGQIDSFLIVPWKPPDPYFLIDKFIIVPSGPVSRSLIFTINLCHLPTVLYPHEAQFQAPRDLRFCPPPMILIWIDPQSHLMCGVVYHFW